MIAAEIPCFLLAAIYFKFEDGKMSHFVLLIEIDIFPSSYLINLQLVLELRNFGCQAIKSFLKKNHPALTLY